MQVQTVTLFLALLAVATQIFSVTTLGFKAASFLSERAARAFDRYAEAIGAHGLTLALGIATVSTLGSLYFSEVARFVPCDLCWYQRIAMYPLVPMLAIASLRKDTGIAPYAMALCVAGGSISIYHMVIERFPSVGSGFCDPQNPCSIIWVNRFGYLTIPTMALTGFVGIGLLMYLSRKSSASLLAVLDEDDEDSGEEQ